MTEISKGEDLPVPGQAGQAGPVPLEIPHGAVGKSAGAGAGAGTDTSTGSGSGSRSESGSGSGSGAEAGAGWDAGSGASGAPSGAQEADRSRPPHRIDLADGGRWADLIAPSPAPSPGAAAVAGILGGEFEDIVYTGRGDAAFTMEETPPPGYVLVEFARTGTGTVDLESIDWNGRQSLSLGSVDRPGRFEQRVMWCDLLYPLRFRVRCGDAHRGEWVIVIRPVSGVRELGEGATGRGSEVLLHTGPAGELVARVSGAKRHVSLRVRGHEPHRPGAPDRRSPLLASGYGPSARDTGKLPGGPLLVEVEGTDGDWSLDVRPARPAEERKTGFWSRLFGR
ncbi:hypothetical protein ACFQ8C_07825 [Streptomyces sp. NPDC056503]|uniref:hypothetical protein n=1 Tax=Streptomyces sp. NPDC056503 TaxID=3345842 RepID=UPI0036A8A067